MSEELTWFEWAFKGIIGGLFIIGGWLWNGLMGDMKEMKENHSNLERDHLNYKTSVAETYASKPEIRNLQDKIDRVDGKVDDIKSLLMERHNG